MANILWLLLISIVFIASVLILRLWQKVRKRDTRESRTEYFQPDYREAAGFRLSGYPENEIILPERFWLIENEVAEIDFSIVPGRRLSLRVATAGSMREPQQLDPRSFESIEQYELQGIDVTQRQSAGRFTVLTWTRDGFDFLLYAQKPEMNMMGGLGVPFVVNTRAESA